MIYFQKVALENHSIAELEEALRKVALKSQSSLDMVGSSTNAGTKMLFVGHQAKDGLTFTRIRYFIEKYLPKVIIKLPTDQHSNYYSIRLGLLSSIIFVSFSILGLIAILGMVSHPAEAINVLPILFFIAAYFALFFLELKLTKARVNKALKNYLATDAK